MHRRQTIFVEAVETSCCFFILAAVALAFLSLLRNLAEI